MKTIERYDAKSISRLTGVVTELHPKSSDNWCRAKLALDTGNHAWVTGKFGLRVGEVVVCDATFDAKFKSYNIVTLIADSVAVVSNSVIVLKLVEGLDGVGKAKAQKLSEKYPNLFEAITKIPQEVADYVGIPVDSVISVADDLEREKNTLNRLTILEKAGWPNHLAKKIVKYDNEFKVAVESPYRAIRLVEGLGWKTADEIGQRQGIERDDPARIEACVDYYYTDFVSRKGHTKVYEDELRKECSAILGFTFASDCDELFGNALANTLINLGDGWYSTKSHYDNSNTIASFFLKRSVNKRYKNGSDEFKQELDSGSDVLEE